MPSTLPTAPDDPAGPAELEIEFVPVAGELDSTAEWVAQVPPELLVRWRRAGTFQLRTLIVARRRAAVVAVAFEVHRPMTAYRKIVDVWSADEDAADLVVDAIEKRAWREDAVAVKREFTERDGRAWQRSLDHGYQEVPVPRWAAPLSADAGDIGYGQVRWRDRAPRRSVPYMRQTTEFTCGPVALQFALCALGLQETPTREDELALWRSATSVPGCDPLGLGVVASDRGAATEVIISTEDATLLEMCRNDDERDLRRFIQAGFRAELAARGIPAKHATFALDDLRDALADGAIALVLIDEKGMHVDSCPHWITVHSVDGDVFYANDPWTDADLGESFLDSIDLPLPAASLDRLAWYGAPLYRGLVLLRSS
jgi:hypothetical protein